MQLILTRASKTSVLLLFFALAVLYLLPVTAFGATSATEPNSSSGPVGLAGDQDAAQLTARANEYWDHKVKGDLEKAYTFEDPETIGETSLTDYVKSFGGGVKWLDAEVDSVTIAGDKARVLVRIRYRWGFAKGQPEDGMVSVSTEFWRRLDGTWYHRFADPRKFRGSFPSAPKAEDGPAELPSESEKSKSQ